jgi:hypothetical protein
MEICSICLEPTENKLECSHHHCVSCLKILVKKKSICPICRQNFNINPYKYNRPKHTPNLYISIKQKRFFNKFLLNRYKMRNCNKDKKTFYSNLMFKYTNTIYSSSYDHKYISPDDIILYNEKRKALKFFIYLNKPYCYYSNFVKKHYTDMIEEYLIFY